MLLYMFRFQGGEGFQGGAGSGAEVTDGGQEDVPNTGSTAAGGRRALTRGAGRARADRGTDQSE